MSVVCLEIFTRHRFSQKFYREYVWTRQQRVNCFLHYIGSKFKDYFIPEEQTRVNESILKFKDRISFITKIINPKKTTKWAIRVYTLADSNTAYICCILQYYGSLRTEFLVRRDLPISSRIPIPLYKMLKKILGAQRHHTHTDHWGS